MISDITEYFKIPYDFSNDLIRKDLPKSLRENEHHVFFASDNVAFDRKYIFNHALKSGWLKYDENTSNTVGAYLEI